jgi:hypothetical protein
MAHRESEVPLDLQRSFEGTDSEISYTKPVEVFPPKEWPPCPDCGDRLTLSSVGIDAQDELLAAQMICHQEGDDGAMYVYESVTGTVYFDQYLDVVNVTEADWSETC